MQEERRLEILGILIIALSVFVLVSIGGYNPSEEPSISPNVQVTNPMGILGIFTAHFFIKLGFGFSSIIIPPAMTMSFWVATRIRLRLAVLMSTRLPRDWVGTSFLGTMETSH